MFKREQFAHLPTPVEQLPRLTKILGGPDLLVKRDDQTGLAFGGNKTRKLEYLMGDALSQGARRVLTTGAAQSNHCRQTAAAAARCGLDCTLVLVGPEPELPSANLLLDGLLGAEVVWTEKPSRDQVLEQAFQASHLAGDNPYLIPYGGSNALGAYAYYQAFLELQEQLRGELPDWIVFASSSGGTQAGLLAGCLASQAGTRILGISVDEPEAVLQASVLRIAAALNDKVGLGLDLRQDQIRVSDAYTGAGYGIMNAADREAIQIFARQEGILLDPVYTGRAGAGLLDLIRSGFFSSSERVLFWHTGGTPALFAARYQSEI